VLFRSEHWVSYAVIDQQWKLVANNDSSYVELYDIAADPLEKVNLKEKKPKVVKQLLATLSDWQASLPPKPTGDVFSAERSQL
jgi:N-acetylgalactosamine-6-sulfatase